MNKYEEIAKQVIQHERNQNERKKLGLPSGSCGFYCGEAPTIDEEKYSYGCGDPVCMGDSEPYKIKIRDKILNILNFFIFMSPAIFLFILFLYIAI